MATAYPLHAYRARMSPRRRAAALALALGVVALVIWALIELGVIAPRPLDTSRFPISFQMAPLAQPATRAEAGARPVAHTATHRATTREAVAVKPPLPRPTPSPTAKPTSPKLLTLSNEEFAASDIGHLPAHPGEGAGDAGAGKDSHSVYGPGAGPGGAQLYNAEWYREPTNAEMAYYLPAGGPPPGWGMVACKTAPDLRVENCRELGESPAGSGLARALRQAAWQFRVRPPRVDGRPVIGAWVRIRFDFTLGVATR